MRTCISKVREYNERKQKAVRRCLFLFLIAAEILSHFVSFDEAATIATMLVTSKYFVLLTALASNELTENPKAPESDPGKLKRVYALIQTSLATRIALQSDLNERYSSHALDTEATSTGA